MKRITAILKTSEATEVRKAIFAAAGSNVMLTTVPHRTGAIQLADWRCATADTERSDYVRLRVTLDDERSQEVISAIIATARTGMIEKIARLPAKESRVSLDFVARRAA